MSLNTRCIFSIITNIAVYSIWWIAWIYPYSLIIIFSEVFNYEMAQNTIPPNSNPEFKNEMRLWIDHLSEANKIGASNLFSKNG